MSERIHGLAQLLPGKNSLEDCSAEELQHMIKRFPYFAPAQFLLLQKLKENGAPEYDAQQRKSALYFHDPLLFDYFISADKFLMKDTDFGPAEQPVTMRHLQVDAEPLAGAEPSSTEKEMHASATEQVVDYKKEPAHSENIDLQENELRPAPPTETSTEEIVPLEETDKVTEQNKIEAAEPSVLPGSPLQESQQAMVEEEENFTGDAPALENVDQEIILAPSSAMVPVEQGILPVAESKEKPVQAAAAGEALLFEPYHTVDYFASQGIKITAEGLPKDKLSRQLRSFTEWLKIMKRLPAAEMEANPQTTAEKTVENLASHSVEGSDVVTEAMAEVWARQGNKQKAIEIYNKLSLLNPSKKAYFAAKIENLSRK